MVRTAQSVCLLTKMKEQGIKCKRDADFASDQLEEHSHTQSCMDKKHCYTDLCWLKGSSLLLSNHSQHVQLATPDHTQVLFLTQYYTVKCCTAQGEHRAMTNHYMTVQACY